MCVILHISHDVHVLTQLIILTSFFLYFSFHFSLPSAYKVSHHLLATSCFFYFPLLPFLLTLANNDYKYLFILTLIRVLITSKRPRSGMSCHKKTVYNEYKELPVGFKPAISTELKDAKQVKRQDVPIAVGRDITESSVPTTLFEQP